MAKRKPIVGGNWKMNLHSGEAHALARSIVNGLGKDDDVETVLCPAFPYLSYVGQIVERSHVKLGAQDVYHQPNGAFTGEVSLSMLQDAKTDYVLAGHSERRHVIGETDTLINQKVRASLDAGLSVILCVGEKLEQRDAGQTDAINAGQIYYGLAGVSADQMKNVVIAYEPVWAIGTGKTATPDDAQSAHAAIRAVLGSMFSKKVSGATRIQYGGSVNAKNAAKLFKQPDIDGGLIGGASLKAADFIAIVNAAADTAS